MQHRLVSLLVCVLAAVTAVSAQPGAGDDEGGGFRNLQILPAEISRVDLERAMSEFSSALGVRCSHCHGGHGGRGRQRDFAADDRPSKEVARAMMRMTATVNEAVRRAAGPQAARVTCFTCHHGTTSPQTLQEVLRETMEARGIDAAIERYGELRGTHYGRATYDFGENTLLDLAGDTAAAGNDDDAIELLRLNLAEFPESIFTLTQLADALHRTGAKGEARLRLEEAVRLDPGNRWVRRRQRELFGASSSGASSP